LLEVILTLALADIRDNECKSDRERLMRDRNVISRIYSLLSLR
jgi:hypothetical protein